MSTQLETRDFSLEPADNHRLASLNGQLNEHLKMIERRLGVEINNRGNLYQIIALPFIVDSTQALLQDLYLQTDDLDLTSAQVHLKLQEVSLALENKQPDNLPDNLVVKTRKGLIKPRGVNQRSYIFNIQRNDISFGVGPAGTGKTWLAVACAVEALEKDQISRIMLVRPAVEAGEKLGFLPGDLSQKVDPYLRPLYDALYEMLGLEKVEKLIERNVIEVAPLAYMRGRTLNDAFIILDESQNTTVEQMKMFLTRIGFNSKAVITGDVTQVDLPTGKMSGLRHAIKVLSEVDEISFTFFQSKDVVRHRIVQRVIEAYEKAESQ
ncbi:PhoH family protein [Pelagibaculum spongiae]|uniref:PhoH-like protein n=1 Tax=Pelagibaculum spongiae TaxID=2080658 RepID=A0A2V1GYY3_9GAMM|nr:PhoH family protein [Pelagibaculum spongiae]PVZ70184.1 phosphate starvation-inducible protein PhoH [Pelagibaculum spongiae]